MKISIGIARLGAVALSFTIYLIPIFVLDVGWQMLGPVLVQGGELSPLALAWIAGALVLQCLAFLLSYWVLAQLHWAKLLMAAVAVPAFVAASNVLFLYAIPLAVLVGRDSHAETGAAEQSCRVPDAALAQVRAGTDLALVHAKEAWIVTGQDLALARLAMPGCRVIARDGLHMDTTIDAVAPGGHFLHRSGAGELRHFGPGGGEPVVLSPPAGASNWDPVLTDDGAALAWLDHGRAGGEGSLSLRLRDLADESERTISLPDLSGRQQFTLIGARSRNGPFTLARFRNAVFSVDLQGQILRGPIVPEGVYNARWGFVWLDGGWVAWDGYRDEGRARIVWDLPAGRGDIAVPRGRSIHSLSVSSDGTAIAYSISSSLRIGDIPSAVVVIRTSDGAEIYRRRHPEFARPSLAFLGSRFLAVSRFEDGQNYIEVLRLPSPDG